MNRGGERALRLASTAVVYLFFRLGSPSASAQCRQLAPPSTQDSAAKYNLDLTPIPQEQFAPYWTTEGGWRSELQMRNNIAGASLTVTPVLRDYAGNEFPLARVTIAPNEIKSVDVSAAVAASAPELIGSYGSVVFLYNSPGFRNPYAAVMIRDSGHPVAFHLDAFAQATDYDQGSREGIWWLPNTSAKDQFLLTNDSSKPIQTTFSLFDAAGNRSAQQITIAPRATLRQSVRELVQKAGLAGNYGGFKVEVGSKIGSLDTAYLLFDETAGSSAADEDLRPRPAGQAEQRLGYPEGADSRPNAGHER